MRVCSSELRFTELSRRGMLCFHKLAMPACARLKEDEVQLLQKAREFL